MAKGLAGFLCIPLPVTRLEEEEPAGPWGKEHPPGQPSRKGTARGASAQLLLDEASQHKWEVGSSPLGLGWLCPQQPRACLCWLGGSVMPTSLLHPKLHPHPTSQRAIAVAGTGSTARIFTPRAIAEAQGRRLIPWKAHCPAPGSTERVRVPVLSTSSLPLSHLRGTALPLPPGRCCEAE